LPSRPNKIDTSKQSVLLALAFEAAAAPASGHSGDVQTVLHFCQAAEVDANVIIKSINTLPDPNGRVEVFKALTHPGSGFKGDNLSDLQPDTAKELALALAHAGKDGLAC
jgi:hypothetical protein